MVNAFYWFVVVAGVILIGCDLVDYFIGHYFRAPEIKRPVFDAPPAQARVIGIVQRDFEVDSIVDAVLSRRSFDDGDDTAMRVCERMLAKHGF